MDTTIIDRLNALIEDSIDDSNPVSNSSLFNNYLSSTFETLFTTPLKMHDSPMQNENDLTHFGTGDFEHLGRKLVNHENRVAIKLMIPSASVGPLIGKGGFFMRTLQHECYVNICPRDLQYAGTTDRVVILKGRLGSVLNVTERITSHVKERCPKAKRQDMFTLDDSGKGYEIRFVVPSSCAELLNKEDSLNEIHKNTGCLIQLYPNLLSLEDGTIVNERIIVITHDSVSHAKQAVEIVLEAVANDPYHISEITKLDQQFLYQRISAKRHASISSPTRIDSNFTFPASPGSTNNFWNNNMEVTDAIKLKVYLTNLVSILRAIHSPDNVILEAINAVKALASTGVLELAISVGMQNFGFSGGSHSTSNSAGNNGANHSYVMYLQEENENAETPGESVNVNRSMLEVLMNDSGALPDGTNYAASVIEELIFPEYVQLRIPERIVGAIIGPKAKMLTEIQQFSRCQVQMERKDLNSSSPDGMRLLNLIGDQVSIRKCRALMERLINEEYRRRLNRSMQ